MPLTLDGTNGVSAVQAGAVESGDLPAGSVIQVVSDESSLLNISTTSTGYQSADVSASITPTSSSSKILVLVSFGGLYVRGSDTAEAIYTALFKDGSLYKEVGSLTGYNNSSQRNAIGSVSASFLDSPVTTSTITYDGRFHSALGTQVRVNSAYNENSGDDAKSTITLMEIAG